MRLPTELLKFRLSKQLNRLKQLLTLTEACDDLEGNFESFSQPSTLPQRQSHRQQKQQPQIPAGIEGSLEAESPFILYQRILSWFIMGRLSKTEYDQILGKILTNFELIELHNRVLELLRAILCGEGGESNEETLLNANNREIFNSVEFQLLPVMVEEGLNSQSPVDLNLLNVCGKEVRPATLVTEALKLTPNEEAIIAESLRNPLKPIIYDAHDDLRFSFRMMGASKSRLCSEIFSLPDLENIRQRITAIGEELLFSTINDEGICDDQAAYLLSRSVEDYLKCLLENAATMKYGQFCLLQPPDSFLLRTQMTDEDEEKAAVEMEKDSDQHASDTDVFINAEDLDVLFKIKPWLLTDIQAELQHYNSLSISDVSCTDSPDGFHE